MRLILATIFPRILLSLFNDRAYFLCFSPQSILLIYLHCRFIINRTTFMSLIIWNILLSFYGMSETNVPMKATSHVKMDSGTRQLFENFGLDRDDIRAIDKEVKQNRKQGEYACMNCGKLEAEVSEKLKSCAKCSAVGRSVRYCSRLVPSTFPTFCLFTYLFDMKI